MPACSRYAKSTAVHETAVGSGAGREAPGRTSHYSCETVLGLSCHAKHLVVRVGQAGAAAERVRTRGGRETRKLERVPPIAGSAWARPVRAARTRLGPGQGAANSR